MTFPPPGAAARAGRMSLASKPDGQPAPFHPMEIQMQVAALKERRALKADALKAIVARAAAENRDLHDQEQGAFDAGKSEVETLDREIRNHEFLADIERRVDGTPIVVPENAATRSWGEQAVQSPELRAFIKNGARGETRLQLRAITNLGTAVAADRRPEIVGLAQRRLVVRDLLPVARTDSSTIEFVQQATYTNAAAPVLEGGLKPESDMTFGVISAPARVIAHVLTVSRQALDDLDQLRAFVDVEMRQGLARVEEVQLLSGNGTAPNLQGMIGVATAYDTARNQGGDTRLDVIHHAIAQLADAGLAATGVVLNLADYSRLVERKDSAGQYLGASFGLGPFGRADFPSLWGVPVAATPVMAAGTFLVADFVSGVTLFDRLAPEVLISSEHSDYFARNLLLVRCEERIALAIRRPSALITGSFGAITA